jgi:hypothetical protein
MMLREENRLIRRHGSATMAGVVELEAKSDWGEVETIEVGRSKRRVVRLAAEELA